VGCTDVAGKLQALGAWPPLHLATIASKFSVECHLHSLPLSLTFPFQEDAPESLETIVHSESLTLQTLTLRRCGTDAATVTLRSISPITPPRTLPSASDTDATTLMLTQPLSALNFKLTPAALSQNAAMLTLRR
jgi:hypothetical protein